MGVEGPGPAAAVSDSATSEYVSGPPAPALRPFVAAYSGYREVGTAPALHRGLPSPWITLILTLDEPLTMLDAGLDGPGGTRRDFDALIGGLHTTPAFIRHEGRQSGIQVSLKPLGARALLGMPAGELTAVDLPAATVLGSRWVDALRERIRAAVSWRQRFDLVDSALLGRVRGAGDRIRPAPEVAYAWDLLISSQGRASVDALGREVGWSSRHLRTQCRLETGLSPKTLGRVVRFDRARRLLGARPLRGGPSLADVAAHCGFADQSHLTRDFRELAGLSPAAWLRAESRSVQDLALDEAEDLLHD